MIALVFCGDLKYCPYIIRYIEQLEKAKIDYKVYFWNRSNFPLNLSDKYVYYDQSSDLSRSKIQKLLDFMKFRKWLISKLEKNHHKKIIALSTLSGVLLGRYLYKRKGKYIFDIRDYSYEHIAPFYFIEKKVIKNSAFTAISSAGFKEFLPSHEYVIAHNFNRNDVSNILQIREHSDKIHYVWNGVMRYFDYQKQFIDALKNDDRFEIVYYGDGPDLEKYMKYCIDNNIHNVVFKGAYKNEDKNKILSEADVLNNCYGYVSNAGNKLKYAVSNKYYDGITHRIPQVVEAHGYKGALVKSGNVGMIVESARNFADRLYEFYTSLDFDKFNHNCERILSEILKEDDYYIARIEDFLKNDGKSSN